MGKSDKAWSERLRGTLEVIQRAKPSSKPTPEDIARLHELHARHEREAGHHERAEAAEQRARRVRAKAERQAPTRENH